MGPHSPSVRARFLGLCHCLISSSLLFASPLPARAQTQELIQGLSKHCWQGSQCLTLCPPAHVRTAQKRSVKEERLVSRALNRTDVEKKKSESSRCMRKSKKKGCFPTGPSSSQVGGREVSCMLPLLSKADRVSGTSSDWGQRPSLQFNCTRAGSPSQMQPKASMVKLRVIFVPVRHSALLLESIPASTWFRHAATRLASSALVLIPPCLAGGEN